ncbi:hypothetical protein [Eubacterium sp.]|uniref:hypothetical protein n=1 Tax=Eubacterium sp. TaxID=142586 RepID=UPI0025DC2AFD|nr:hypothetical protein [Eubacterium sp.]MCR5630022.1 hypothetical protein [Eubacterium sp.]
MKCKGFKGRVHSKPGRLLFLLLLLPALAILLVPFLRHSKDMAGWIEIPDTDFSYPVMQSGKEGHREDTETGSRGQLSNMGYY